MSLNSSASSRAGLHAAAPLPRDASPWPAASLPTSGSPATAARPLARAGAGASDHGLHIGEEVVRDDHVVGTTSPRKYRGRVGLGVGGSSAHLTMGSASPR